MLDVSPSLSPSLRTKKFKCTFEVQCNLVSARKKVQLVVGVVAVCFHRLRFSQARKWEFVSMVEELLM